MAIANYFYNETTRRYVALFGTIFNQLKIERKDNTGTVIQDMIVPLSYAPFQKVLSRLNEDPDLLNSTRPAMSLPRMSFEITSLSYDPARKIGSTQKMRKSQKTETDSSRPFMYASVPYDIEFSLYIMTKYAEDATKIMEQIIPFFTPDWTVTASMVPDLDPIDIPIVLNSVTTEDLYEGDYETRQTILYTLTFTLKGYYFGPEKTKKVIKFIDIDMATSTAGDAIAEEGITIRPGMTAGGLPLNEDGIASVATAEVSNGSVTGITIVNDGENYDPLNVIPVTISAPSGLNAQITPTITNTGITDFTITEAGGFYSAVPAVTISAPDSDIITATGSVVISGDTVGSIDITNSGTYYSSATVSVDEPPAKSAYVYYGDDALYHNIADTTFSHVTDYAFNTAGNGFAIEFWIRPEFSGAGAADYHILHIPGQTMRIEIEVNAGGAMLVYRPHLNSVPVRSSGGFATYSLNENAWNHVRLEHYGSTAKWLLNGTAIPGGNAPQGYLQGGGATVNIGQRSGSERSFIGALDNLIITQISGLTADGAYTVPTSAQVGSHFTDDFDKDPATATATVLEGEVTAITVTNAGANYANTTPSIVISDPDGVAGDYQATATAILTNGAVTDITINNIGKFYITANVAIDAVVTETATATIAIDGTGQATGIAVTNAGLGYSSAPTVTVGNPAAVSVPYQQIEFDDDWGIITIFEDV